jgi:hypothetical protein
MLNKEQLEELIEKNGTVFWWDEKLEQIACDSIIAAVSYKLDGEGGSEVVILDTFDGPRYADICYASSVECTVDNLKNMANMIKCDIWGIPKEDAISTTSYLRNFFADLLGDMEKRDNQ